MLEKEFEYFLNHKDELLKKYNGKVIVIKGTNVIGVFNDEQTAYFETEKTEKVGTFLIQRCEPGEGAYSQTFHSRVAF